MKNARLLLLLATPAVLLIGAASWADDNAKSQVAHCLRLHDEARAVDTSEGFSDLTVRTGEITVNCFSVIRDQKVYTLWRRCLNVSKAVTYVSYSNLGYIAFGRCLGEFGRDLTN